MEITNCIIQFVNQPKMEQFNLNNQGQLKVQFTPFLSFTRQCVLQKLQSIQNSDNLFDKMIKCIKKKTIYIGLLDIKQQNLNLLFKNIDFTKRVNNDQPVLYISQQVQQSDKTPFRFVYLSNQKNDSQHHALLASILMTVSSSIIYQFNSKYVRSSKQSQTRFILLKQLGYENTQSDQFVLISQKAKSDVYKISLTQNNRMQIKQKFSFPTDIMDHLTLNNCLKAKKIQLSLLKQCFQFYWNKYMHLFQEKHSQLLQQLIFLTLTFFVKLQNQVKFYQYLIKKEQCDQQVQQSNVFFTFQNIQSLKTSLKSFLLSNKSKQKIRETILKIIFQQIQLFKQESLIKILQNLQNQYFCSMIGKQESQKSVNYLLESEQLKIKEQQIVKKLLSQNIKSEYFPIVTHHYQTNLMKNHIKVLQLKISQQELCIQAGQNQIVQKSIKINYLQSQLEEQSKRNFLLKQISQQLQIMQQKLYQANLDKRTLKMDIQTYLNQIKQFKQREVRLQGIINAHREQKNNMLQAIGILTKENFQYLCKIKQKDQTIKQLQQKNYHLQHIERLIIKQKQKNMILQQNLNQFKKYHDQIEKKWTCFKERQLIKFNFILSENWNQYQKQLKKTEHLQAKIQKFQLEFQNIQKQKKIMEIQVDYFQKVFYQKTCGGIIESQMNNSRQKPFYQMNNIHKMQQIFESIEEDFTTDRIKESQIQFDKVKILQNQPKQLKISNF